MTRDERNWFHRTFDAGNRPTVQRAQFERLRERANTLDEAVNLAASYERRGDNATAGVVRFALEQRAKDTRDLLGKLSLLETAEEIPSGSSSAVSSGAGEPPGDLGRTRPELPAMGEPPSPAVPAGPSPTLLDSREARIRLELVAEQLDVAIQTLSTITDITDGGRVWKLADQGADFLRTVQAFCRGDSRLTLPPPPALSLVKNDRPA